MERTGKPRKTGKILRTFCVSVAVYILLGVAATELIFGMIFARKSEFLSFPSQFFVDARTVEFLVEERQLTGYLIGESGEKGVIVIAHGMDASAESFARDARRFEESGYCVLVFDGTGCGESEGRSQVGLGQRRKDLIGALDFLDACKLRSSSYFLYGHSAGGYAAASLCNDERVAAVVSVAAPDSTTETMTAFGVARVGALGYLGYPFLFLKERLLFGAEGTRSAHEWLRESGTPVLVLESERDRTIPPHLGIMSHAEEIGNPQVFYQWIETKGSNAHTEVLKDSGALAEAFFAKIEPFAE